MLVKQSPSLYSLLVESLGVGVALTCIYWLNRYMNQVPVTLRSCKGSIVKAILLIMALANLAYLLRCFFTNLAHKQTQWLLNTYPDLMCLFINQRGLNLALNVAINLLVLCEISIILYPLQYHSANHEVVSVYCQLVIFCIPLADFVFMHLIVNYSSCQSITVQNFLTIHNFSLDSVSEFESIQGPIPKIALATMLLFGVIEAVVFKLKSRRSQVHPAPLLNQPVPTISRDLEGARNENL